MKPDFGPLDIALEKSLALGADQADAFLEQGRGLTIKVFDLDVEKFGYSENRGIGLRVFIDGRPGRAYTSDLSPDSIARAAGSAVASARVSPPDEHRALPSKSLFPSGAMEGESIGEDLSIWADDLDEVPAGTKIEFALDLERRAREYDERVKGVESAVYGETTGRVTLANTLGFRSSFRSSVCYGYLMAMAEEDGESQTGFGFTAGRSFSSLDTDEASIDAATMAVDLLGGRQVETRKVPVLFDTLSTAEMLAVLGIAVSGDSVVKGKSFLAGKLGERIASENVRVVDDGLLKGGFGTVPFDGEGVATRRKPVIEDGVLATFLHNCYTASRMDVASTGNAGRPSFRGRVVVTPTNIVLEPGDASPDELRSGMDTGFEVLELQGVHVGLNPVTGEVSVGAKGLWIEGGQRSHAVREVTIAGKIEEILQGVAGIGDDLRFTPLLGGIGAPSILVEGLVIGGK